MKSQTKTFLGICALTVAYCAATYTALGEDHIRISEDRRRLGIQLKPPNEPTRANGKLKWRSEHYEPHPGLSYMLYRSQVGQEQGQEQEQRRRDGEGP